MKRSILVSALLLEKEGLANDRHNLIQDISESGARASNCATSDALVDNSTMVGTAKQAKKS